MVGPLLADVAHHEAGHALIALRLGREVKSLRIADDRSGNCEIGPPTYPATAENVVRAEREALLVVLAGPVAEEATRALPDWWRL